MNSGSCVTPTTRRSGSRPSAPASFSFEDFDQFKQVYPQTDAYVTRETEEPRGNDPIRSEWYGKGQAVVGGVYYRPAVRFLPRTFLEEDRD